MRILLFVVLPLLVVGWCLKPGRGVETAAPRAAVAEPVATISHGEAVDLDEHLAPGEWTLFEFGADW